MLLTCLGTKVRQVEKKLYADAVPVAEENLQEHIQISPRSWNDLRRYILVISYKNSIFEDWPVYEIGRQRAENDTSRKRRSIANAWIDLFFTKL